MKLIIFTFVLFFSFSGSAWSLLTEYNCLSSSLNSYYKEPIRFQINKIQDGSSSFSLISIKKINETTRQTKWSDWSFIEVEDGSKDRLVWFSYKDELQDKKMLKIPYHRFRFNILDLKLISERAYQPRGMLSAQLGNYSCVVVKRAF